MAADFQAINPGYESELSVYETKRMGYHGLCTREDKCGKRWNLTRNFVEGASRVPVSSIPTKEWLPLLVLHKEKQKDLSNGIGCRNLRTRANQDGEKKQDKLFHSLRFAIHYLGWVF